LAQIRAEALASIGDRIDRVRGAVIPFASNCSLAHRTALAAAAA
jgi:hypothetical protein